MNITEQIFFNFVKSNNYKFCQFNNTSIIQKDENIVLLNNNNNNNSNLYTFYELVDLKNKIIIMSLDKIINFLEYFLNYSSFKEFKKIKFIIDTNKKSLFDIFKNWNNLSKFINLNLDYLLKNINFLKHIFLNFHYKISVKNIDNILNYFNLIKINQNNIFFEIVKIFYKNHKKNLHDNNAIKNLFNNFLYSNGIDLIEDNKCYENNIKIFNMYNILLDIFPIQNQYYLKFSETKLNNYQNLIKYSIKIINKLSFIKLHNIDFHFINNKNLINIYCIKKDNNKIKKPMIKVFINFFIKEILNTYSDFSNNNIIDLKNRKQLDKINTIILNNIEKKFLYYNLNNNLINLKYKVIRKNKI